MVSADILFPFAADLLFNEPAAVRCSSRCPEKKSRSRAPKAAPRPILIDVNEVSIPTIDILCAWPWPAAGVSKYTFVYSFVPDMYVQSSDV